MKDSGQSLVDLRVFESSLEGSFHHLFNTTERIEEVFSSLSALQLLVSAVGLSEAHRPDIDDRFQHLFDQVAGLINLASSTLQSIENRVTKVRASTEGKASPGFEQRLRVIEIQLRNQQKAIDRLLVTAKSLDVQFQSQFVYKSRSYTETDML